MSETAPQKLLRDQWSGSGHTAVSRHLPRYPDLMASKRVCFYKSGDPQFSGLKLVINNRTFKSFDALLDSLSKKVPLPFGVRNITTPRGVHAIKTLGDLQDGQSYICSDQKKVKPINLEMARKKLPPWYSARPVSGRQRAIQLARQNMARPTRRQNSLGVWTPKRLVVFKNGDSSIKHNVLLQRKTMQTFESLLDYMCEMMQFPVVKLYTSDGRRVDGLPALILCSGAVVAAGREPFKSGNYDVMKPSLVTRPTAKSSRIIPNRLHRKTRKKKSRSSSTKSRNFSLSSEKYFVNQIQNSIAGSLYDFPTNPTGSAEMDPNAALGSVEADTCTCAGDLGEEHPLMPPEDDIEKSFRVNQDGSMTVEMKVRLTIKEEETIHWSTTLTRSSVANQLKVAYLAQPELESHSPGSTSVSSKENDEQDSNGYESKEENNILPNENGPICEKEGGTYFGGSDAWPSAWRAPTPGLRKVRKKQASVESIKMETEAMIQENVVGTYSCKEETIEGEVTEECCIVRKSNSRPIPKPRNMGSIEINNNKLQCAFNSMGVSNILQMQEHGGEITETLLHICEQQSCHDSYFPNKQCHIWSQCEPVHGQPAFTDTGLYSPSNDSEVDPKRPFPASESFSGLRAKASSLSSVPRVPACKDTHDLANDYNFHSPFNSEGQCAESVLKEAKEGLMNPDFDEVKTKPMKTVDKQSFLKRKEVKTVFSSHADSEKQAEKKSNQKPGKRKKRRKGNRNGRGKSPKEPENTFPSNTNHSNGLPSESTLHQMEKKLLVDQPVKDLVKSKDLAHRQSIFDLVPPVESTHITKVLRKHKSMDEEKGNVSEFQKLCESVSLPASNSLPSVVNEYVEHWLKKSHPKLTPYTEDTDLTTAETETRVVFHIRKEEQAFAAQSKTLCKTMGDEDECQTWSGNATGKMISGDLTKEKVELLTDKSTDEEQQLCILSKPEHTKAALEIGQNEAYKIRTQTTCEKWSTQRSTEDMDMGQMIENQRLSIEAINPVSQHKPLCCLEKSKYSSDFSSLVTSTFGSSSQVLLAFLSEMTLKEDVPNILMNESSAQNVSCTEALKMIESLNKIASIEDAEKMKASLSDLQCSASSQLLQCWKTFQELREKAKNHSLSFTNEYRLSHETIPQQSNVNMVQPTDIQESVAELRKTTKLQEESSAFVYASANDQNMNEDPAENCHENGSTESSAGKKVSDGKEPSIQEQAINFMESNFEQEVSNYIKSIIQKVSSMCILDSKSVRRTVGQKTKICQGEEQEYHDAKQTISNGGTDSYTEEPLFSVEKQGSFIQHQPSFDGNQLIHENGLHTFKGGQGRYVEDGLCCTENESIVVKQAENTEWKKRNEEESNEEEPARYDADDTSFNEKLENGSGNKLYHEDQPASDSMDQESCSDEQFVNETMHACSDANGAKHVNEQENNTEWQLCQGDEQSRCEEQHNNHESESCAADKKNKSNHKEENSYIKKHISYEENESTYDEKNTVCAEEKESFAEQCPTYTENQYSYEHKQVNNNEQRAVCEEEQVTHLEEHFSSLEENHPPCEEQQHSKNTSHLCTAQSSEASNHNRHDTEEVKAGVECVPHNVSQSVKMLEDLNKSLSTSSLVSSLAFSYDSKGGQRRESEGTRVKSIREMFLARNNLDVQYGHKRLPSPNTSEISDYRPETSDSGGYRSQASLETSTESGEDESGRQSIVKGYVRRTIERLYGRNDITGKRPPSASTSKRRNSPSSSSVGSLTAYHEAKTKAITDLSYFNATSSYTASNEPIQCVALNANVQSKEGVLIDKGRWLLKDDHLIRKSPPENSGMHEIGDPGSGEAGRDYASDGNPYSHFRSHHPPVAAISSPEFDDPCKTAAPKCTYFSLPHGSDSDFLQDELTFKAKDSSKVGNKNLRFSPAAEETKVSAESKCSLPSFASAEFRKMDNKVHPKSVEPVVVNQPTTTQGTIASGAIHEQDPLEMLYLMCGQHCPIL